MTKTKFVVTGMTCSACSSHVEKAVSKLEGVKKVSVNLLTGSMLAEYDESVTSAEGIVGAVTAAGYGAYPEEAPSASSTGSAGAAAAEQRADARIKAQREMRAGNVRPSPYDGSCKYCKFRGACGFVGEARKEDKIRAADIAAIARAEKEKEGV